MQLLANTHLDGETFLCLTLGLLAFMSPRDSLCLKEELGVHANTMMSSSLKSL